MNTTIRGFLTRCGLAVILTFAEVATYADTFRPFNPANPTDPYSLNASGEMVITSTGYNYHHWGVLLDETTTIVPLVPLLSFTALSTANGQFETSGTFSLSETDMFVNDGTTTLNPFDSIFYSANFSLARVSPTGPTLVNGIPMSLIRRYHFATELYRDTLSTPNFDVGAPERLVTGSNKKLIVLIHGWNTTSSRDSYDEPDDGNPLTGDDKEFLALRRNIGNAVGSAPDWSLVLYRWAQDADTGPKIFELNNDLAVAGLRNGSEAAEAGHRHGKHLGQLLADLGVEKVHLIVHSAGTWVARSAAERVIRLRPNAQIAITLLDPFVPGALGPLEGSRTSGLGVPQINAVKSFGSTGSVYRLENYFSDDVTGVATEQVFSWRASDENGLEVGGGALRTLGFDPYGGLYGHFGPIQYYADTVHASSAQIADPEVFGRLSRAYLVDDFSLNTWGWRRSMFMQEPVIQQQPANATVAPGGSASFTVAATTRLAQRLGQPPIFTIQWQKLNGSAPTIPVGTGGSLQISQANSAVAGIYRAKVSSGTLVTYSNEVTLTVTGGSQPGATPATLGNLVATAVSSSQINLTWTHSGTNVSGFELQRRLSSSATWVNLPAVGATGRTFANTAGLSADTSYVYQIRAMNGGTPSPWSGEVSARTFLAPASNVSLSVYAVDNSSGSAIPLNVAIATWSGDASNFSTLTTLGAFGFTRTFPVGVAAWFSAPTTLPDGRRFQYWLFGNGTTAAQDFFSVAKFNLTGATSAFAHYAFTAPPTRTLTGLTLEGPSSVDENSSASYKARASYSDGGSGYVGAVWDEDSGYADISSSGVLDTEAISSDKTVEIEATYTVGGVTRTATKNVTIRNAASTQTYTLTRNVVGNGEIGYSPKGSSYPAGTVVSLHRNEGDGYVFSHWSGDASGTEDDITIRMDENRSVTAHFVVDTTIGNIRVDISPPQAVAEGAQWKYDNFLNWRPSGDTQDGLSPRTNRNVYFKEIPGWITPPNVKASIVGGQTTVISGAVATYREILGGVQVTITPAQAAAAGARWRLDGGAWAECSVSLADVSTGTHTIEFLPISGWGTPPSQSVTVARGITTTRSGDYTPPAGFPIITSVAPRTGPIAGGTTITFDGATFQPGATVTFGGVPATSVTVVSSTRITAVTPPRASYGTVPLALTSDGQTVTQANGFSYLNALGSNIELVGQIGGNVETVAVVGNIVYYGEGPGLVVSDFTNSAAPVERGRIALPGVAKNLFVVNGIAYVAVASAGLYAVNVSNPAAPSIIGFFDTEGSATGVTVAGSVAYVADCAAGLQILDITNPTAIVRLGVLDTAGDAQKVAAGTIGTKQYAFVAERNSALRVIDASDPAAPAEVASMPGQTFAGITDVKLVGTTLYISDWQGVVKILNVTDPAAPLQIGSRSNVGAGVFLDVVGTRLYTCSGYVNAYDLTVTPNPALLGQFEVAPFCYDLVVANGLAFAAMGRDGLKIV